MAGGEIHPESYLLPSVRTRRSVLSINRELEEEPDIIVFGGGIETESSNVDTDSEEWPICSQTSGRFLTDDELKEIVAKHYH